MAKENYLHYVPPKTTQSMRQELLKQRAHLFWFTGLSGAGKSTLAEFLGEKLYRDGRLVFNFDGDNVRHGLCRDLGFSEAERSENIRRIGEMCKLFIQSGVICLAAFISPLREMRETVRNIVGQENFSEIYVHCPLEECEKRDVKGNYKRARAGLIKNYTGISSPYEEPEHPDITIMTNEFTIEACVIKLYKYAQSYITLTR